MAATADADADSAVAAADDALGQALARCLICAADLRAQSLPERERHLNACLDGRAPAAEGSAMADADADANADDRCVCPSCGADLTPQDEQQRNEHVNRCLDLGGEGAAEADATATTAVTDAQAVDVDVGTVPLVEDPNACRICGLDIAALDMTARVRHVKKCGQKHGVRAKDLIATKRPTSAPALPARDAFAVLMQRPDSAKPTANANAFDMLMKGSRTQTVMEAAAVAAPRPRPHTFPTLSAQKKRRVSPAASASASAPSFRPRAACPAFKRIPGTSPPFIVDGFQYASKELSSVYFLTHFHSDHYGGINRSFDCGMIYCSPPTAALVQQQLGVDPKWLHPVPLHTPLDIHGVRVTFMDANHCPGAVLLLFRLPSGKTYLHVGDFRFHPSMLECAPLRPFVVSERDRAANPHPRLDGVFLDTTYAEPKYVFPTQQAAIAHALGLMDKHMSSSRKVLFLFGSYSIGKERLFMEAAAHTQRKVCVSKAKHQMIATFGWSAAQMALLTTEAAATNLHVVPMQELSMENLGERLQQHRLRFHEIVAFRPTGWTFSKRNASMSTCQTDATGRLRIYGIPYSEHSSFAELCAFVRALNPLAIIPTVNCHSDKLVKKQVNLLRQTAFHSIASMWSAQHVDNGDDGDGTSSGRPGTSSGRPGTSSGRSKAPKRTEFRTRLENGQLPLTIETAARGAKCVVWTTPLEQLDYMYYLPLCLGGVQEVVAPYASYASDAAMQLLEAAQHDQRVLQCLPQTITQIKSALNSRDKEAVHLVLLLLQQMVICDSVGEALSEHYRALLPLCNLLQDQHLGTGDLRTKHLVLETLETLEAYGTDDAHALIQQFVPTFASQHPSDRLISA